MAGNADLFKALDMFKQSVGEFNLQRTVSGANDRVQQIRAGDMDDQAKKAELQNVSNELVMRMAGMGAPATSMAAAANAIAPPPTTQENAAFESNLLAGREKEKNSFTARENALDRASKETIAMREKPKQPLNKGIVDKIQGFDDDAVRGQDILNRFNNDKDLVSIWKNKIPGRGIVNPEYAAFKADVGQWFDTYRVRVTGAGAGPSEIKLLMQNRPKDDDTQEVFAEKMKQVMRVGGLVKQRYMTTLKKTGHNVDELLGEDGAAPAGKSGARSWEVYVIKKQ